MSLVVEPDAVAAVPSVDAAPESQPVGWRHRHLLDVDGLSAADLDLVMRTTDAMREVLARPIAKVPALRGRQVTILFYEASTRTRVSFEVAARNLSADVVNIAAASSSVSKGESLVDTVRTVEALGAHMLVMRHNVTGAPYLAAEIFGGSVLNGGDGWHAHPTQALLDLYTIRSHLGDASLAGRKVVILGDLLHSRVARSNIWTLTAAGADLWLCGPATLLRGFEAWAGRGAAAGRRFHVTTSVDEALRDADVVMALRIQRERMASGLLPSLREYAARYGLTAERLRLAKPGALVMHPGPMNEGVEIAADVAAGSQSVITDQVTNGVAVRMAMLYLLAGAREPAGREGARCPTSRSAGRGSSIRPPAARARARSSSATGSSRPSPGSRVRRPRASMRTASSSRRASSTCTPTCANPATRMPRRWRPARRGRPRRLHDGLRHAEHDTGARRARGPGPDPAAGVASGSPVELLAHGAVTAGRAGETLAALGELADAGVVGLHRRRGAGPLRDDPALGAGLRGRARAADRRPSRGHRADRRRRGERRVRRDRPRAARLAGRGRGGGGRAGPRGPRRRRPRRARAPGST